MTKPAVLLPAEAARRIGVPTRVIIQAMYERKVVRVKLPDGTLGIPADSLDAFRVSNESLLDAAREPHVLDEVLPPTSMTPTKDDPDTVS